MAFMLEGVNKVSVFSDTCFAWKIFNGDNTWFW